MRLQDIMNTRVETISPRESAAAASNRMRGSGIRHLVVQDDRRIVGLLSERDLKGLGSFRQVESVEDVMTSPVVTASPETTLRQAANLMRGRSIGSLPIVDNGRLAGIVTVTDLLERIGRGVERPVEKGKRWILKGRGAKRRHPVIRERQPLAAARRSGGRRAPDRRSQ
ncbi:MAG TPA: CBS domain-containing protein [Thermoanaerobaculia bacterium]